MSPEITRGKHMGNMRPYSGRYWVVRSQTLAKGPGEMGLSSMGDQLRARLPDRRQVRTAQLAWWAFFAAIAGVLISMLVH
jgi:hypothetical protein